MPLFQPSTGTGLTAKIASGLGDYLLTQTDRDMRRNVVMRIAENALDAVTGQRR